MSKANVILLLFTFSAILQLLSCIPPVHIRLRYATKILLMPILALWFLIATSDTPWTVFVGLIFSFFGDLFLLAKAKRIILFVAGSLCFAVGHILYSIFFLSHIHAPVPVLPVILLSCVYAGIVVWFLAKTRKNAASKLLLAMTFYYSVISFMSVSALIFMIGNGFGYACIPFAGSVLFLFSDYYLGYDAFNKKLPLRYFIVMLTYIAAQFCIAYGVYLVIG